MTWRTVLAANEPRTKAPIFFPWQMPAKRTLEPMASAIATAQPVGIPEGYRALPIHQTGEAPLRLCVLVRPTPDPVAGHFILLRDLHDALVYLGCVTDAGGQVREWVELWVQNVDGLEASLPAYRETFSNASLDERWSRQAETFHTLRPAQLLRTGWESTHPLPIFLDLTQASPLHPGGRDPAGPWELCRD